MMCAKLGLREYREDSDSTLFDTLWEILSLTETDMTLFFRHLAGVSETEQERLLEPLMPAYYVPGELVGETRERVELWVKMYLARVSSEGGSHGERRELMNGVNPKYVLRNYLAQEAITGAEQGDFGPVPDLL